MNNNSNAQTDNIKEENKESDKKEEELFTTEEEKNLYLEIIDLKDYVPEMLLITQKKIDKSQNKADVQAENIEEQQPQMRVLNNNNQEISQNAESFAI